jgi:pantoate kinase
LSTHTDKRVRPACAWAPGHITGFFGIEDADPDPLRRGSRGAGISLAAGVVTSVNVDGRADAGVRVLINHIENPAPVSRRVIDLFLEKTGLKLPGALLVEHEIAVPQGAGFGSSGAGALSLALALNEISDAPLSPVAAAQIAHRAEVECRTGLGTVLACTVGGLEVRTRAGAPGVGTVRSFPLPPKLTVCCLVLGPRSTAQALADQAVREKINTAYARLSGELLDSPDAGRFMRAARTFTDLTGLASAPVRGIMAGLDRLGIVSSMNMFGDAVFSIIEREQRDVLPEIENLAAEAGCHMFETRIALEGGAVTHDS